MLPAFTRKNATSSVPAQRLAHLRHGINASEWFAQVYDPKGYTKEHFQSWTTTQDITLIKTMGFDHIRLSVNPQPMFRRNRADEIPADYLGYLDDAVKTILIRGSRLSSTFTPKATSKPSSPMTMSSSSSSPTTGRLGAALFEARSRPSLFRDPE